MFIGEFPEIYERKVKDLVIGWIVKADPVERVLLDSDENKLLQKNMGYEYDRKIMICYHKKKEIYITATDGGYC